MNTALPQKFPFISDRNLAKANCTGNRVCTSCDIVVLGSNLCISNNNLTQLFVACSVFPFPYGIWNLILYSLVRNGSQDTD